MAHSLEKCPFKNYDENFSIFFGLKVFSGHHGSSPNTRLGLRSETQLKNFPEFVRAKLRVVEFSFATTKMDDNNLSLPVIP